MREKYKPKRRGHGHSAFAVGQKAVIRFGDKKRLVRIIEDRGKIGRKGRQLLRVAFSVAPGEPVQPFEIPADDVTALKQPRKNRPKVAAR